MKSPIQFYNIKQGNIYLRKKGNAVVLNIHDDGRIVVQLFFKIPQFSVLIFRLYIFDKGLFTILVFGYSLVGNLKLHTYF